MFKRTRDLYSAEHLLRIEADDEIGHLQLIWF